MLVADDVQICQLSVMPAGIIGLVCFAASYYLIALQLNSCTLPWQWRLPLVVSGGGACRSSASVGVATDMLTDACAGLRIVLS